MTREIRCTGAFCSWRDQCIHYVLSTTETRGLRWPVRTGPQCDDFEPIDEPAWSEVTDIEGALE